MVDNKKRRGTFPFKCGETIQMQRSTIKLPFVIIEKRENNSGVFRGVKSLNDFSQETFLIHDFILVGFLKLQHFLYFKYLIKTFY